MLFPTEEEKISSCSNRLSDEAVILTKLKRSFSGSSRQHNHRDERQHLVRVSTNVNIKRNERIFENEGNVKNVFAEVLGFKHLRKQNRTFSVKGIVAASFVFII